MKAPLPPDEPERLEALRQYAVLDTPPEDCFGHVHLPDSDSIGFPGG
jgi:hypothetical protein